MRTRFLVADDIFPPHHHAFHRLPLPPPPPPPPPPTPPVFSDGFLRGIATLIPLPFDQLDGLAIDAALQKFLSDVLPHTIELGSKGEESLIDRPGAEDRASSEGILGEGLTAPCFHENEESVYAVEDMSPQYSVEEKLDFPEQADLSMSRSHVCKSIFPLLEVKEIITENDFSLNLEDVFLVLLEYYKFQNNKENSDTEINCRELLSCNEIDLFECASEHCLLDRIDVLVESDLLNLIEPSYTQEMTQVFPVALGVHYARLSEQSGPHEEFIMLDIDVFNISEALSCIQRVDETKTQMEMEFKSFEELIVSHELAVANDSFKSFPVPVRVDDKKSCSLQTLAAGVLSSLDELPASASDEIYLDWQLLGKDKCNCDMTVTCQKVFNDIEPYSFNLAMQFDGDSDQLLGFDPSGDSLSRPASKEDRLSMMSAGSCTLTEVGGIGPCNLLKNKHLNVDAAVRSDDPAIVIAPPFDNHCSQFNDLEFFLNPLKPSAVMGSNVEARASNSKASIPGGLHMATPQPTSGLPLDAHVHEVHLSANLLILLNSFQKRYMAIFEDYQLITKTGSFSKFSVDMNLLSLTEAQILECVCGVQYNYSIDPGNSNLETVCALCAIKRMAWCLIFYGIHALHVFITELLRNMEFLKSRLSYLQSLVEDAYRTVEGKVTQLHPALALIEHKLLPDSAEKRKLLIVADLALWWPLKRLLESMNMSVVEMNNSALNENRSDDCRTGALVLSDCFLALREHVPASLIKNKFDVILEYGGPHGSSVVSDILPKSSPQLHFFKIEVQGVAKALCEGVGASLIGGFTMKLEELLDFSLIVEKCNSVSAEVAGTKSCVYMTQPIHGKPRGSKPKGPCDPSFRDSVIIVNTQNFQKEMIISRRSTYQSILAMEKDGAQVVERDLVLPVDIIISASMCLAWYDCGNIGKKATAPDEASSSIPLCVDDIAANVLTSLSFTFSSCILVFEGDNNFLGTIMESSDVLYAAAASLGIELQIFFSHSPELTEEIIISCIRCGTKLTGVFLPKLSESETLAESFLTKFPSINPLTAHAILSTVGLLVELFECSRESRKCALQKYLVPEETIFLFSVLCRYRELEDSKSGTTDCSSSVSSAPTSEKLGSKFTLEKQKQKTAQSHCLANNLDAQTRGLDGVVHYLAVSKDSKPMSFISPRLSEKRKLADISLVNELFGEELRADAGTPTVSDRSATCVLKGPQLISDVAGSFLPLNSRLSGSRQKSGFRPSIKPNLHDARAFQDTHRELMGEVIDIDDESLLGEDFASLAKHTKFFPPAHETDENQRPKVSKAARKLSFDNSYHPDYPSVATTNSDYIKSNTLEDWRQGRVYTEDVGGRNYENTQSLVADSMDKPTTRFLRQLYEERGTGRYRASPLSKAVHSDEVQQGSPWTIEFLNRVREKSRLRKQCLPSMSPIPSLGYPSSVPKAIKRKSPSILEHLKYQGGSTPRKSTDWKRQNQFSRPSTSSKIERTSASPLRAWTPLDKRARKTLSFTPSGNSSQTRLVWSSPVPNSLF